MLNLTQLMLSISHLKVITLKLFLKIVILQAQMMDGDSQNMNGELTILHLQDGTIISILMAKTIHTE